ncbi:pyruvate formate lyase family protein [Rubrivivax gelatinosus]|uniref:pyruvate formate lyase family protein n=1 Tax=Rubrivivax gelatinosus TaxID=28068 RepID=UPI0002F55A4E|nr:pyruvate formate lyase family protein [Rubrivivax gelatinosus]
MNTMTIASSRANAWEGFAGGRWETAVDVRDFIQKNYTPYGGELLKQEQAKGVLDVSADRPSTIVAHDAGYIDQGLELIVGLQTDAPLKRAIMPNGGLRMVQSGLKAYGFESDPTVDEIWTKYRKSHNQGVFDVYSTEIAKARKSAVLTGLPDAYGRGRIIGDYRRVALYGVDALRKFKQQEYKDLDSRDFSEDVLRLREELSEQGRALEELKVMGAKYGFDLGRPAQNAREAVQWTYLGYLAAVKEQNGAAMSLGRVSTFLDIYIQRDLDAGLIDEARAQEFIDDLVVKLRIVRFLRTPEYDQLFSGDPTWVTEAIGGIGEDGRPLVTKNSFRFLQTLNNLGPAPEPNLTVLWSEKLPQGFKDFCAKTSIDTCSVQYENDDLMRPYWGDDYGIACCVSAMRIGKQMQFFGARANLAKALLYAINGGRDEVSGEQVGPVTEPITGEVLDYDEVIAKFVPTMEWLSGVYMKSLNAIHFMHDKYAYERIEMALHDRDILRTMACGVAGLSVVADSLSAMRHAKVHVVRDERGLATEFRLEGRYPASCASRRPTAAPRRRCRC